MADLEKSSSQQQDELMRAKEIAATLTSSDAVVIVMPVLFENEIKAVIELASLSEFTASQRASRARTYRSIFGGGQPRRRRLTMSQPICRSAWVGIRRRRCAAPRSR